MDNFVLYIIIGLIIVYLLTGRTQENFQNMNFLPISLAYNPSLFPWPSWWPWNQPTRLPRLYYDIRGDPNIVFRHHMLGGYTPYGYMFGPYLYDSQGNLLYDSNKPHYIA